MRNQRSLLLLSFGVVGLLGLGSQAHAFNLIQSVLQPGFSSPKVVFKTSFTGCESDREQALHYIDETMKIWNSIPTSALTVSRGEEVPPGQMVVLGNGEGIIHCEPSEEITEGVTLGNVTGRGGINLYPPAAIQYPGINSRHVEYNVLRNPDGSWKVDSQHTLFVFVHEMGHALGLGHSQDPRSVMTYSINTFPPILGQDDIDAMTYLFPRQSQGVSGDVFGCNANASTRGNKDAGKFGFGDLLGILELAILTVGMYFARRSGGFFRSFRKERPGN